MLNLPDPEMKICRIWRICILPGEIWKRLDLIEKQMVMVYVSCSTPVLGTESIALRYWWTSFVACANVSLFVLFFPLKQGAAMSNGGGGGAPIGRRRREEPPGP